MCPGLKSGLDTVREKGVNCRTKKIEERVKKEIEDKFGEILIPEKQYKKILRQDANHKKKMEKMQRSLMKAFQQREAARLIQKLRNEKSPKRELSSEEPGSEKRRVSSPEITDEGGIFNEIDIEY